MHQRSWLAVKPIHKSSPPPATPPMRGRWAPPEKEKANRIKYITKCNLISKKELPLRK